MIVLAIDPSGNFPGGTTAFCQFDTEAKTYRTCMVRAKDYNTQLEYWNAVTDCMIASASDHIVCEDFILYAHKATAQSWSSLDTARLVGVLEYMAHIEELPFSLQRAVEVMKRWADDQLIHAGYLKRVGKRRANITTDSEQFLVEHEIDALRHAVHYATFKV